MHKLVNCIVILDEIYTNLNKLEKVEVFVNKVKENLYNLYEEYICKFDSTNSTVTTFTFATRKNDEDSVIWSR